MIWPERTVAASAGARTKPTGPTLAFGVRLGAAGATAAAIGFLLDLEHVGWACAAALLVMRPAPEMQRLRSMMSYLPRRVRRGIANASSAPSSAQVILTQISDMDTSPKTND